MILKKYLYAALAVVSAIALAACSDDEGTDPGHDSAPVVTIYEYAAPEDYDADITENIRIVPNDKVSKMFVYTELQTDTWPRRERPHTWTGWSRKERNTPERFRKW